MGLRASRIFIVAGDDVRAPFSSALSGVRGEAGYEDEGECVPWSELCTVVGDALLRRLTLKRVISSCMTPILNRYPVKGERKKSAV